MLTKIAYYLFLCFVVCIAVLVAGSALPIPGNYQLKVVLSGSMEPTIPTGSVIIVQPTANYTEGDIITFGPDTKTQIPTTHRIVSAEASEGTMLYRTKGDANEDPDGKLVQNHDIIGKVWFWIPYFGYLINFAKTTWGFVLLVIIPALLVMADELSNAYRHWQNMKREKSGQNSAQSTNDQP